MLVNYSVVVDIEVSQCKYPLNIVKGRGIWKQNKIRINYFSDFPNT